MIFWFYGIWVNYAVKITFVRVANIAGQRQVFPIVRTPGICHFCYDMFNISISNVKNLALTVGALSVGLLAL